MDIISYFRAWTRSFNLYITLYTRLSHMHSAYCYTNVSLTLMSPHTLVTCLNLSSFVLHTPPSICCQVWQLISVLHLACTWCVLFCCYCCLWVLLPMLSVLWQLCTQFCPVSFIIGSWMPWLFFFFFFALTLESFPVFYCHFYAFLAFFFSFFMISEFRLSTKGSFLPHVILPSSRVSFPFVLSFPLGE